MKVGKPSYNVFINLQMAFFHNLRDAGFTKILSLAPESL